MMIPRSTMRGALMTASYKSPFRTPTDTQKNRLWAIEKAVISLDICQNSSAYSGARFSATSERSKMIMHSYAVTVRTVSPLDAICCRMSCDMMMQPFEAVWFMNWLSP